MTFRRRLAAGASATLGLVLVLGACSADTGAQAAPLGSSASGSVGSDTPAPGAPGEPGEPGGPGQGRQVPAECAALTLAPGATLEGAGLGECVSRALSSFGSGVLSLEGDPSGEVDFTYDPDYSFHGDVMGFDGPISLTFLNGTMWVDSGNGPVKGDPDSEDPEEMMAGMAAVLYRMYSDIEQTASLVAAQPVWRVQENREPVTLPDGSVVDAYRIVSDAPFVWNEFPVSEYVLWYGEDWLPVGSEATISVMGQTATNTQKYYDLGKPVTIVAPTP